jgi:hypothetical protein
MLSANFLFGAEAVRAGSTCAFMRAEDDPSVLDVMRTKHGVVSWMRKVPANPEALMKGGRACRVPDAAVPLIEEVEEGTDKIQELAPAMQASQDSRMICFS